MATMKGREGVRKMLLQTIPAALEKKVARGAARAAAEVVAAEIKEQTPSEAVRNSVRVKATAKDGIVRARVFLEPGWGRTVGEWLEWGTSPHFITVDDSQRVGMSVGRINRQGKDKADSLKIGGEYVGKTVYHPGARPHPTFRPALDTKEGEALDAAQKHIDAVLRRSLSTPVIDTDDAT